MNKTIRRLAIAAAAAASMALIPLAAIAAPASASAGGSTLSVNQVLQAGQDIVSPGGQYYAVVQTDGNFVLYTSANRPLWASNTVGTGSHDWLVMQSDGNLVLYTSANRPVWASSTNGTGSGDYLNMQTDGNLVVYTSANRPVWATNTVQGSGSSSPALGYWAGSSGQAYAHNTLGYPYPYPTNGSDKWSMIQGQCTSWVAYRLNELRSGVGFWNYYRGPRWGNAGSWGSVASGLRIPVNGIPAVGSVAWYGYSGTHPSGHVAYVEKVNSPTSIVISEMNVVTTHGFRVRVVTKGTSGWPTGFIHIADR